MMQRSMLSWVVVAAALLADVAFAGGLPPLNIPRIQGIEIDGKGEDWEDKGLALPKMMPIDGGGFQPGTDLEVSARAGWNDSGLLLLLEVTDDLARPDPQDRRLWMGDCVHLYLAHLAGSEDKYQILISPPDKDQAHRIRITDRRSNRGSLGKATAKVGCTRTPTGYGMEILLPWENAGVSGQAGRELALQIYVADSDAPQPGTTLGLVARGGAGGDSTISRRILLRDPQAEKARPLVANADAGYVDVRRTELTVTSLGYLAGKQVEMLSGGEVIARGRMIPDGSLARARIEAPFPPPGQTYQKLTVEIDGQEVDSVSLPDARPLRARMLLETDIVFDPYVFSGNSFPSCDFGNPQLAELLLGRYRIETTFYDARGNQVQRPTQPGRYGAVIDILPDTGRPMRRLRTLLKLPAKVNFGEQVQMAGLAWPEEAGFDSQAVQRFSEDLGRWSAWQIQRALTEDVNAAGMLAALMEKPETEKPLAAWNDAAALDRQYWVMLKRKITGNDRRFPNPPLRPSPIQGKAARVIRPGSPDEAGMTASGTEAVDSLLTEWARQSDEAFAVCIARRGTAVLHKAYGTREGKPMTVDTPSWMASITKMLGGICMMMLVDQGLADLDDPVSKYLPAFDDSQVTEPLTIRHCYTHTSGLWGHWGDDIHDHEYLVGYYYPLLPVAKFPMYNGADNAIGGKIIEQISGLAMPQFYHRHLLGPLGCENTTVRGTFGDATSTPMDIARIGQMILNGGAYGSQRFLSPESIEALHPSSLKPILGYETRARFGIGTMPSRGPGVSNDAFGHGAASAATFIIDPQEDLVIVMTRNSRDDLFDTYHPRFLKAVYDAIQEQQKR